MSARVAIEIKDDRVYLRAPYSASLPAGAKKIGGRFDGSSKSWHFDPRDEERVRALAVRIFGTDGTASDLVTIQVRFESFAEYKSISIAGTAIVEKRSRDELPRVGGGAVLVSGGFSLKDRGSRAHPQIGQNDAVIELRDVPRAAVPDWEEVTVLDERIDFDALNREKAKLVARLAEIEAMLAQPAEASEAA